tara:strand:- start:3968 stop:4906 length:939 start_codon:yes stop_codon:yes gene_type:complete
VHFKLFKKMLEEWAQEIKPVFIVGPERSGTSLLFQQVSNHPDFCDFAEATVETFCFVNPWKILEPSGPWNYEMRLYLGQSNVEELHASLAELIQANKNADAEELPKEFLYKANADEIWQKRDYSTLLRAFFYYSWNHLGKKRLVEKTPAHIRCTKQIFEAFPNAKILVCLREPGEIIASHKKRYQKEVSLGVPADSDDLAWLRHPTEFYLNYFKEIDGIVSALKANRGDAVKVVSYRHLTHFPNRELKAIFDFIGCDYIDIESAHIERVDQAWDPLLSKLPQPNEIDIKSYLSADEIKLVAEKAKLLEHDWK